MDQQELNKDLILREELALQRTRLANQSTFLAFLRTAMYFLIAGLSVKNFYTLNDARIFENILLGFSGFLFVAGVFNYFYQYRLIKRSEIHVGNYQLEYLKKRTPKSK
jgi:putative membrane protein